MNEGHAGATTKIESLSIHAVKRAMLTRKDFLFGAPDMRATAVPLS